MTETITTLQRVSPVIVESLEPSLDSAPLELTVTTTISSLSPSSPSSISSPASSSHLNGIATSDDLTVGPMEPLTVSPKSELDTDTDLDAKSNLYYQHYHHYRPRSDSKMSSGASGSPLLMSDNDIKPGARFLSFADFERIFENWKASNFHPFRVASSETLRLPDGSTNAIFKYRYIVYHCAHYGAPRMRGAGKRPNQNYMPCGCKAMLRLNYSWSENALRVTTLNDEHVGHDVTEDAYFKFAAKAKQRQSSSSPPTVTGSGILPSPTQLLGLKRRHIQSPLSTNEPPVKVMKNGHSTPETPLNLSKSGLSNGNQNSTSKRSSNGNAVASTPTKPVPITPTGPNPASALSVLMFNHQQHQEQQQRQQHAYQELMRLLSVNGGAPGVNASGGLVTALGANGVQNLRLESERHRLIMPIMQALTQQLAGARGYDFDEKLRDLKSILKKWQLIPTIPASTAIPSAIVSPNFTPGRVPSAAAAAAAMMVQAMSVGAGSEFVIGNGIGNGNGNANTNGNGNAHGDGKEYHSAIGNGNRALSNGH